MSKPIVHLCYLFLIILREWLTIALDFRFTNKAPLCNGIVSMEPRLYGSPYYYYKYFEFNIFPIYFMASMKYNLLVLLWLPLYVQRLKSYEYNSQNIK